MSDNQDSYFIQLAVIDVRTNSFNTPAKTFPSSTVQRMTVDQCTLAAVILASPHLQQLLLYSFNWIFFIFFYSKRSFIFIQE